MKNFSSRAASLLLAVLLLTPLATSVTSRVFAAPSRNVLVTLPGDDDTEPTSDCLELTRNLRYRSADARTDWEVSLLQDFLNMHGYLAQEPTGFFSLSTQKAVKAFQKNNGLRPTGYVSSLTREKIRSISCDGTLPDQPVPVGSLKNLPPVIDGITAPSSLSVGETGTWTVKAHDPENRPLTYSVSWGEVQPVFSMNSSSTPFSQTVTFTHSYAQAGSYTVQIQVKDDAGNVQKTSATVQVGEKEATLTITQQDLSGTKTATTNAKDLRLMRFKAQAGEAQNILFTRLVVESAIGGSTLKNGTNYALWVDTNNDGVVDTILERNKAAAGSDTTGWTVTFDGIPTGGFVILKGQAVDFEVHSDITPSLQPNPALQLRFALSMTYVEAKGLDDGTSLKGIRTDSTCAETSCRITVTTAPSTLWNLVSQDNQNLPPVIDGITAPSSLSVGETGTWTVKAHDPENRPLTYSVSWGEAQPVYRNLSPIPFSQTATFTHSYARAGTYTVRIQVKDDAGNVQDTSATVQVGKTEFLEMAPFNRPISCRNSHGATRCTVPSGR